MKPLCRRALLAAMSIAAMLAFAMPAMAEDEAVVLDRVVAVVNDEPITWLELHEAMRMEAGPRLKGMSGKERSAMLQKAEREYLETLVIMRLQLQQARKKNLLASDEDIDAAVNDIRQKYGLDDAAFRAAIKGEELGWDDYRRKLAEQITIRRLVDREVRAKLPKPPGNSANSGIKKLPLRRFQVRLIYLRDASSPETQAALERIYAELSSGREFEEIEAGFVRKPAAVIIEEEDASPELLSALSRLSAGEVSQPVESGGGVSVIKLLGVADEESMKMEALFEERYRQWLKGLLESAFVDVRL